MSVSPEPLEPPGNANVRAPRRVLLLTSYLWGGGAEWHALNLAWSLRQLGLQIDVAYLLPGAADAEQPWRRWGFEPMHLPSPRAAVRIAGRAYDLIHAHLFKAELAGAALSRALHTPLVISRHSLDWDNLRAWERALLAHWAQRSARGVIAVTETVKQTCLKALAGKAVPVRLIYHGMDPQLLHGRFRGTDIRSELGLVGKRLLGTAARLSPDKGLEFLLRAFALAGAALADWDVVIAGDGPEREALSRTADRLGIADRVHLLGWREDALDIVASLDLFVMPSLREGFGQALLEAMLLGVPAIASDLAALREVAGEAVAYVPPGDASALAEKIVRLAESPRRRENLAAKGRQRARRFDATLMARRTLAFYSEVLRSGRFSGSQCL